MDINLIRSLTTLALFILFVGLIYLVFNKKTKARYDDAANIPFEDGDERSQKITNSQSNSVTKVNKP